MGKSWVTPFVTMLPPFWRCLQCLRRYYDTRLFFPHMVNAGKYSCAVMVVFLSSIYSITDSYDVRILWIAMSIVATCFAYAWGTICYFRSR